VGWWLNTEYGACYKSNIGSLAKNWNQARLACKALKSELASNRDKGEKVHKYNIKIFFKYIINK
jgi:hypothetical protein